jgi:DNA-directed RNA polymerase I subunit RPA2
LVLILINDRKPVKNEPNSGLMAVGSGAVADNDKLFPSECRLRSITYSAPLYAVMARKIDSEPEERITVSLGDVPVMVRSQYCHLNGLSEVELVKRKEDMTEFGGYFVINGNERLIRMLIMTKRNYPIAFQRGTFINRGRLFTPFAVLMRCVREDLFSQTLTLHYLSDGNCMMRMIY